jgi:hypothetical protein
MVYTCQKDMMQLACSLWGSGAELCIRAVNQGWLWAYLLLMAQKLQTCVCHVCVK